MGGVSSLAVWVAGKKSGLLVREKSQEYIFAYHPEAGLEVQVSLTMPVRLAGWISRSLHPVFQMNLPEGALLETIRRTIAKLIGEDDLSILRVTGGNQIGRNRFSLPGDNSPHIDETPESLNELLTFPDTRDLFHELVKKYALRSGISGIQPKVMLEATERATLTSSGYIVKTWGTDYPQLAATEFFCMTAAKRAGLPVPEFYLSDNGGFFILRRFDISPQGGFLGFEDMCSLQALGTSQKYTGSYERVAGSLRDFVSGEHVLAAREQFFASLVLCVMLRNGDGHLKNFGVLYDSPQGAVTLAPVYDIVTTTAYIPQDVPALTIGGTKKWWSRKIMERFAITHLSLPIGTVSRIIQRMAEAVTETRPAISAYQKDHPEFKEIGDRMLIEWEKGIAGMLKN
jgi:serine/threonine-protein kinase HipA